MKGFLEDIVKLLGLPEPMGYKCILIGGEAVFLQGIRHVKSYEPTEIVLAIGRKNTITVSGEQLYIDQLNAEEVVIKGKIVKIEQV